MEEGARFVDDVFVLFLQCRTWSERTAVTIFAFEEVCLFVKEPLICLGLIGLVALWSLTFEFVTIFDLHTRNRRKLLPIMLGLVVLFAEGVPLVALPLRRQCSQSRESACVKPDRCYASVQS